MSEKETSNIDSWDGLLTNFLKADNVECEVGGEVEVVCYDVKRSEDSLDLAIEYNSEKFIFSLNKTNMVFLKENGISSPKEVIGKKLILRKSMAMNPTLKKEVPTLRISKVE